MHAMIDGHDAILEIDTGSFELRLSPEFANKYGLDQNRVTLKLGNAPTLSLRPLVENFDAADPLPLGSGWSPHSDGIVGLDVLRMFAIGIDTNNGKVTLWYKGNLGSDAAEGWAHGTTDAPFGAGAKLSLMTNGVEDWYRVQTEVNHHPLNMLLDTGTAYSTVNASQAIPLGLKVIGETPVQEIGHSETLKVATADSITFGPCSAEFPVLNIESSDDEDMDGILGTEALGAGKFLLDLPANEFYAWQEPDRHANPLERRLREAGIDLFPTAKGDLVTVIKNGSPASEAGISSGDELKSIGGVSLKEIMSGLASPMDSKRMGRLVGVGLNAFGGQLSIGVQTAQGKLINLALPE